jgi:hypothetical protein
MSEADEDKAELCRQTRTGTSSVRWKTARWRKVGRAAARAAHRAGQEATTSDDRFDQVEYSYNDYRQITLEMS